MRNKGRVVGQVGEKTAKGKSLSLRDTVKPSGVLNRKVTFS